MVLAQKPILAGIALSTSEQEPPATLAQANPADRLALDKHVRPGRHLVSVEAIAFGGGASRSRFGHTLPARNARGIGVSDLLGFASPDTPCRAGLGAPDAAGTIPKHLWLDLSALRPGIYEAVLEIRVDGEDPAVVRRQIEIADA